MQAYCAIWAGTVKGKLYVYDEVVFAENQEEAEDKFGKSVLRNVKADDGTPSQTRVRDITAVLRLMKHEDQSPQSEDGSKGILLSL